MTMDYASRSQLAGVTLLRSRYATIRGSVRRKDPDGLSVDPYFDLGGATQTLIIDIDGTEFTITFPDATPSMLTVLNLINTAISAVGRASDLDGVLHLKSLTAGGISSVSVTGGSAALALGFDTTGGPIVGVGGDIESAPQGRALNPHGAIFPVQGENLTTDSFVRALGRVAGNADVLNADHEKLGIVIAPVEDVSAGTQIVANDELTATIRISSAVFTGIAADWVALARYFFFADTTYHLPCVSRVLDVQKSNVSVLGTINQKVSVTIAAIHGGKFVKQAAAVFTDVRVGDYAEIVAPDGDINAVPWDHRGLRWVVDYVSADSTTVGLRPMSRGERSAPLVVSEFGAVPADSQPITELNGTIDSVGKVFGTLNIYEYPFASDVDLLIGPPLPPGMTATLYAPVSASLRDTATPVLGEDSHRGADPMLEDALELPDGLILGGPTVSVTSGPTLSVGEFLVRSNGRTVWIPPSTVACAGLTLNAVYVAAWDHQYGRVRVISLVGRGVNDSILARVVRTGAGLTDLTVEKVGRKDPAISIQASDRIVHVGPNNEFQTIREALESVKLRYGSSTGGWSSDGVTIVLHASQTLTSSLNLGLNSGLGTLRIVGATGMESLVCNPQSVQMFVGADAKIEFENLMAVTANVLCDSSAGYWYKRRVSGVGTVEYSTPGATQVIEEVGLTGGSAIYIHASRTRPLTRATAMLTQSLTGSGSPLPASPRAELYAISPAYNTAGHLGAMVSAAQGDINTSTRRAFIISDPTESKFLGRRTSDVYVSLRAGEDGVGGQDYGELLLNRSTYRYAKLSAFTTPLNPEAGPSYTVDSNIASKLTLGSGQYAHSHLVSHSDGRNHLHLVYGDVTRAYHEATLMTQSDQLYLDLVGRKMVGPTLTRTFSANMYVFPDVNNQAQVSVDQGDGVTSTGDQFSAHIKIDTSHPTGPNGLRSFVRVRNNWTGSGAYRGDIYGILECTASDIRLFMQGYETDRQTNKLEMRVGTNESGLRTYHYEPNGSAPSIIQTNGTEVLSGHGWAFVRTYNGDDTQTSYCNLMLSDSTNSYVQARDSATAATQKLARLRVDSASARLELRETNETINLTKADLKLLVGGPASNADSLHTHTTGFNTLGITPDGLFSTLPRTATHRSTIVIDGLTADWHQIVAVGDRLVAFAFDPGFISSAHSIDDGRTWVEGPWIFGEVTFKVAAAAYGNYTLACIRYGGTEVAYSSTNGDSWFVGQPMPVTANWHALRSGKVPTAPAGSERWVAVASDLSSAYYCTAAPVPGQVWTAAALPGNASSGWHSIAYAPDLGTGLGRFVAVASDGTIAYSDTGGASWVQATYSGGPKLLSVVYGNRAFVAIRSESLKAVISTDGITWSDSATNLWSTQRPCQALAYGNGLFVALAGGIGTTWQACQVASVSRTGGAWTEIDLGSDSSRIWSNVAYYNGTFVGISSTVGQTLKATTNRLHQGHGALLRFATDHGVRKGDTIVISGNASNPSAYNGSYIAEQLFSVGSSVDLAYTVPVEATETLTADTVTRLAYWNNIVALDVKLIGP
jgi:hypothetical protein